MEYVQGESLTHWCDAQRLGIRERLGLFLQVLEAVRYAHEKQVIHRDLKPSNIMVSGSGQVRLLDFGVASLLESADTGPMALTGLHGRALTPDYASPELLRGEPIDVRTDLYSLGVLLYELLTGTRPYRLKRAASIGAIDQAVASLEVRKPSTQLGPSAGTTRATTAEQLTRQLRGDLDAVALKALAKDPARRYPSAAALADDLRRFLDDKPIRARPPRIAYRLGKLVRRNGTLLGVAAVALAAIVVAVGYALYRESRSQVTDSANAFAVSAAPSPASTLAAFAPPAHSIAVLPFLDMSEQRDQDYFAVGLSEELIDLLTKVPDLHVPARTSSFYFKGKLTQLAEIAKALNVANVLEGSVRKSGHAVRITVHMIRVDSGYDVWSQTYDRNLKDIFRVQDEIAAAVVQALTAQLLSNRVEPYRPTSIEAYTLFLQGRYLNAQDSGPDWSRATHVLQRAMSLDPDYALAWAALARSHYYLAAVVERGSDRDSDMEAAGAATRKALALNPADAATHYLLALIKVTYEHDWNGAVAEMDAGRRADPELTEPRELVEVRGCTSGPCQQKYIHDISRDIERDPLNVHALADRAWSHAFAGELDTAESDMRRVLAVNPGGVQGIDGLALVLIARGKAA
jgi:TolB-like protein